MRRRRLGSEDLERPRCRGEPGKPRALGKILRSLELRLVCYGLGRINGSDRVTIRFFRSVSVGDFAIKTLSEG